MYVWVGWEGGGVEEGFLLLGNYVYSLYRYLRMMIETIIRVVMMMFMVVMMMIFMVKVVIIMIMIITEIKY